MWLLTLTCLHELALTPKHLRERAAAAGERLLHGWIPSGGEGPSSAERQSALGVSLRLWIGSAVALEQTSPLTFAKLIISNSWMKPPQDLLYTFPSAVICFFYSCLPTDCRSVLCQAASDAVRVAAAPQLMGDLCWVALRLLINAPVALLQTESTGKHSMNKARERARERERWEGEACCREKTDSLPRRNWE